MLAMLAKAGNCKELPVALHAAQWYQNVLGRDKVGWRIERKVLKISPSTTAITPVLFLLLASFLVL